MSIAIGQNAPDFTLFTSDKKELTLSSLKGKNVVLLFFPQAFTGTCTEELCHMRDNLSVYDSLNAEIIGISVDSVFTLGKWKDDEKFGFTLCSDFNKEVSRLYGVIYENWIFGMKGVSMRAVVVIDAEGTVRYTEVVENPGNLPDLAALKSAVEQLG
jgi:peroxiredoxin